jgi:polyisoprenoid-binding protein YceI
MKTHIALLAAVTILVANASAEKITFDLKDPKGVNNIVFKLDAPLESINGTANGISGTVLVDPAQPEEIEGKIIVDTKSLTVSNSVMQEHMLGADWLDAETHPQITFEVKEVLNPVKSSDTEGTADVKGVFTLKGVSKEITAPAKVTYLPGRLADRTNGQMEGDLIVIRTNFQINRSDFGIKAGENLDKVSETIDISLSIAGSAPKS